MVMETLVLAVTVAVLVTVTALTIWAFRMHQQDVRRNRKLHDHHLRTGEYNRTRRRSRRE